MLDFVGDGNMDHEPVCPYNMKNAIHGVDGCLAERFELGVVVEAYCRHN